MAVVDKVTMRTPLKIRVLQLILCAGALVLAVECCLIYYPPLLLLGYALAGKSPDCTTMQAFHGAQVSLRNYRAGKQYAQSPEFRLLETEGKYSRWKTPEGEYWVPKGNEGILRVLLAQQTADIYSTENGGIQDGGIVLDCGAHIGIFTRKALRAGAGRVIAIEPGPENLECLKRNLREEIAKGSVTVYPKGIWDSESNLTFQLFPGNRAADSFVTNSAKAPVQVVEVQVTTIDLIASELGLRQVDLIKMDIKGSTTKALVGARNTLKNQMPRLVISTEEDSDRPRPDNRTREPPAARLQEGMWLLRG